MRVISGSERGRKLTALEGMNTRPTTDNVKESVFNIIQFLIKDSPRVLDMFAGSGQMGIEALSRGAKSCVFADSSRDAVSIIKKNVKACSFEDRSSIFCRDSFALVSTLPKKSADVIFLDPPYGNKMLDRALETICMFDILDDDGIIVCESSSSEEIRIPEKYELHKRYVYGRISVTVLKG